MPWLQRTNDGIVLAEIVPADAGTTKALGEIQAGWLVRDVWVIVQTALGGGTPSITVGDATDADGWLGTADITETTPGVYKGTAANGAAYVPTGKYYATRANLTAAVSAGLTSGRALVIARVIDLSSL
jgi:hypothetical protein